MIGDAPSARETFAEKFFTTFAVRRSRTGPYIVGEMMDQGCFLLDFLQNALHAGLQCRSVDSFHSLPLLMSYEKGRREKESFQFTRCLAGIGRRHHRTDYCNAIKAGASGWSFRLKSDSRDVSCV